MYTKYIAYVNHGFAMYSAAKSSAPFELLVFWMTNDFSVVSYIETSLYTQAVLEPRDFQLDLSGGLNRSFIACRIWILPIRAKQNGRFRYCGRLTGLGLSNFHCIILICH
jgi:hypothetical protein